MLGVQDNPANASNASGKITQVAIGDAADMQLHLLSELKSAQISDVPCRKLWSSGSSYTNRYTLTWLLAGLVIAKVAKPQPAATSSGSL